MDEISSFPEPLPVQNIELTQEATVNNAAGSGTLSWSPSPGSVQGNSLSVVYSESKFLLSAYLFSNKTDIIFLKIFSFLYHFSFNFEIIVNLYTFCRWLQNSLQINIYSAI